MTAAAPRKRPAKPKTKRINSRSKGKVGELELAKVLREHGFTEAKRGQQFKGGADSPDVVGIPGIHPECKRVEQGSLYTWLAQAIRDAGESGNVPVVMHRRNDKPWVAILPLDEFLRIIKLTGGLLAV